MQNRTEKTAAIKNAIAHEKAAARTYFFKRERQFSQEKEDSLKLNKARYDEAKRAAELVFQQTPKPTWVSYQTAEAIKVAAHKTADNIYINAEKMIGDHLAQLLNDLTLESEQRYSEIERRYLSELAALSDTSQSPAVTVLEVKHAYQHALNDAHSVYRDKIADTQRLFAKQHREAFALYSQIYQAEDRKLHAVLLDARKESFRMVAKTVGLDDVALDVNDCVTNPDDPYASIQPLLSYTDLRHALMHATRPNESSLIIEIFYSVLDEPLTFDTKILREAVNSFDLAANSQIFKHHCSFTSPTLPLIPRTLYVELSNDAVTCTVLCPYGNVITTSYDALSTVCLKPLKDHIQSGQILSYIQDNVSDFITDIYYRNRVRAFDPFSDALASVEGLKEYMIKTIYTYNKEMTRAQGLEFVKLTKTHLCRSAGYDYCEFETTPLYLLNKAATTIQEAARKDYEASNLAEQEVYKEAARELDEARSLANRVYSSAMASIQLSTAPETLHDHSLSPVKTVPAAAPLNKVGHLMLHGPREEPLKFQEIKSSLGSGSIQENAFSDDEDFDAEICAFMEHGIMDH